MENQVSGLGTQGVHSPAIGAEDMEISLKQKKKVVLSTLNPSEWNQLSDTEKRAQLDRYEAAALELEAHARKGNEELQLLVAKMQGYHLFPGQYDKSNLESVSEKIDLLNESVGISSTPGKEEKDSAYEGALWEKILEALLKDGAKRGESLETIERLKRYAGDMMDLINRLKALMEKVPSNGPAPDDVLKEFQQIQKELKTLLDAMKAETKGKIEPGSPADLLKNLVDSMNKWGSGPSAPKNWKDNDMGKLNPAFLAARSMAEDQVKQMQSITSEGKDLFAIFADCLNKAFEIVKGISQKM